jgi:hypothetical protein
MMRDLQRVCTVCGHKQRCKHDLAAGIAALSELLSELQLARRTVRFEVIVPPPCAQRMRYLILGRADAVILKSAADSKST